MEIKKFVFFVLLCITCVTVTGRPASDGNLPHRENQLFNLEMKAPYPGDTVDLQFDLIGIPYISFNEKYWTPLPVGLNGHICDINSSEENFCHLSLMHNYYFADTSEMLYNSDDFMHTYHSFFDMIWRPEEDQTCLIIIYTHNIGSHIEVLLNISSIDEMTDNMTFITSIPLPKAKGVQTMALNEIPLKKYQKYILSIIVRTKGDYFEAAKHRKNHNWFGLLWINQLFDCVTKPMMKNVAETTTTITTTEKYRAT